MTEFAYAPYRLLVDVEATRAWYDAHGEPGEAAAVRTAATSWPPYPLCRWKKRRAFWIHWAWTFASLARSWNGTGRRTDVISTPSNIIWWENCWKEGKRISGWPRRSQGALPRG